MKDGITNYKTEDFVNEKGDSIQYKLKNKYGQNYFAKRSSGSILSEMKNNSEDEYMDSCVDIEKEDVEGLGPKAFKAFKQTYINYIKYFYKYKHRTGGHRYEERYIDNKSEKKYKEFKYYWDIAIINFKKLSEIKETSSKYVSSLKSTLKAMELLREVCRKQKNIRGFLLANTIASRAKTKLEILNYK